jgi:hypothetical protein
MILPENFDFRDLDNLPEVSYTTWEIYEEACRYLELMEHVNETNS